VIVDVRVSQCHDAVVNHMRAVPQFEVIAPGTASYTAGKPSGLTDNDRQAARAQGAGQVLIISTEMGCGATLHDAGTGDYLNSG
jgi:hypothetical protein